MHRALGRESLRLAAASAPRLRPVVMPRPSATAISEVAARRIHSLGAAMGVRPVLAMDRMPSAPKRSASSLVDGAEKRIIRIGEVRLDPAQEL